MLKMRKGFLRILKSNFNINQVQTSSLNTSGYLFAGKLWRMSVGLPKLQTAKGSLTDLPDYSFLGKEFRKFNI